MLNQIEKFQVRNPPAMNYWYIPYASMENQQGWNGKGVLMKVHHPLQGNARSHHKPQAVRRVGMAKGYS